MEVKYFSDDTKSYMSPSIQVPSTISAKDAVISYKKATASYIQHKNSQQFQPFSIGIYPQILLRKEGV